MGAAKDKGIDPSANVFQISLRDAARDGIVAPTFFGQGYEQRTSAFEHVDCRINSRNRFRISGALHSRFGGDHSDSALVPRPASLHFSNRLAQDRRPRARPNHPHDIDLQSASNRRQRERRSGVASDDQHLDSVRRQETRILNCVPLNRRQRLCAVRHPRRVAQIDEALIRQMLMQRAIDSKSADARVKDSDGKGCNATMTDDG